ncbi:MAG: hypothetical protein K2M27_08650 [Muribaculaceae bacterium]|nr:hypothetical protein [Muribaculaceae bacterium]MDE6533585.1 hypothetical protein [Muribaculaceae bacterium]
MTKHNKQCAQSPSAPACGNAEDVNASAIAILGHAEAAGMFGGKASVGGEKSDAIRRSREWIDAVRNSIDSMTPGDALSVISSFDAIHRVAFGVPADTAYLDRYRLAAFEAYLSGDTSVDPYMLFRTVSSEVERRNKAYLGLPVAWECDCLGRWFSNFRYGTSRIRQSLRDTVCQVTALLSADLRAFTPHPEAFKRRLLANHSHLLPPPDSHSRLSTIGNTF